IDNLSFEIPKGFSTALIGTNGAGKTTLLDILAGINLNFKGKVEYFGKYDTAENAEVRNAIGYTAANNYFGTDWSVKNIQKVLSCAFDNFSAESFDKWLVRFGIEKDEKKKMMTYSDGNIMRVMLASVLARDTKLLLLDEPASPLDPVMRDELCDIFREYISDGERSVFFSTHNIADMENVTDYAIIMSDGRIIEQGFTDDLLDKYIVVHGDGENYEKNRNLFISSNGNASGFEGIALSENAHFFERDGNIIERPHLQQVCVALLKSASK
ncbi:MAG: ATP-binding cassette domain-containing protein, partial [Huintestinicola sp.]